jgi:hypothetical protein
MTVAGSRSAAWLFAGLASVGAGAGLVALAIRMAGGFAYPLDDTYIHLEVAWQWLTSGTFGLNPGEFAFASSSLAWTALLAGVLAVAGHATWAPLLLNALAAFAVFNAARTCRMGLVLLAILVPVPVIGALGMEHLVQCALALALMRARSEAWFLGLAAVAPLVRYEALLQIAVLAALLAPDDWRRATRLLLAGVAPVAAAAAWSVVQGGLPVPNGVVMKSVFLSGRILENVWMNSAEGAGVVLLAAGLVLHSRNRSHAWYAATVALQVVVGAFGWYWRYEAWLVAWGLVLAADVPRNRRLLWIAPALVLLGWRAGQAWWYFPGRCTYIHDVKVELARALPPSRVALHDVGAVAWYTDNEIVDIAGLGTQSVAALSAAGAFTGVTIGELVESRKADVALAVRSWMADDLPPGWVPIATLEWGLDDERRIEPIVAYGLRPGADVTARRWLEDAVRNMGGRGRVGVPEERERTGRGP